MTPAEALTLIASLGGIAPNARTYRKHRIPVAVIRTLARTGRLDATERDGRPVWMVVEEVANAAE